MIVRIIPSCHAASSSGHAVFQAAAEEADLRVVAPLRAGADQENGVEIDLAVVDDLQHELGVGEGFLDGRGGHGRSVVLHF
jgi:hypothetical protein